MDETGNLVAFLKGLLNGWTDGDDFAGVVTTDGGIVLWQIVDVLPVCGILDNLVSEDGKRAACGLIAHTKPTAWTLTRR